MGKSKHKKHHRHDIDDEEGSSQDGGASSVALSGGEGGSSGLKLILKVGASTSSATKSHSEKHKKKKKKKDRKKEKEHKHRHHHKDKDKMRSALTEAAADLLLNSNPAKAELLLASTFIKEELLPLEVERQVEPEPHPIPVEFAKSPMLLLSPPRHVPLPQDQVTQIKVEEEEPPVTIFPTIIPILKPVLVADSVSGRSLTKLLEHFIVHLQKKDTNQIFANPVDDNFAPGYSEIIKQPMDFSTMRSKLNSGKYPTLSSFSQDFELMCNNACIYNLPETVYYKMAKKLLHQGQRMMSQDKVFNMKYSYPYVKQISEPELGFDITSEESSYGYGGGHSARESLYSGADDDDDVSKVIEDIRETIRRPIGRFEAIPDDMSTQEILDQVRAAAGEAANRLRIQKPKTQMGYLKQDSDGTTSMIFLPSGGSGKIRADDVERPVSLAALIAKIKQGSVQIYERPSLNTSASASEYDSVFSKLTEEETDMISNTYGDDVGVQYAESILNFSRKCEYAMFIVDHLLDILTGNEHQRTSKYVKEQKALRREDDIPGWPISTDPNHIDFDSLRSLSDQGIDVSFIDSLQLQFENSTKTALTEFADRSLHENAQLINQLREAQLERLKSISPSLSAQVPRPGPREVQLASLLQRKLMDLANRVMPENPAIRDTIHKVLGVSLS